MKIYAGRTLLRASHPQEKQHLWIILTEPAGKPATVAAVNLTSEGPGKDTTVRLGPGDHPFIRKPTVVFFAKALILDISQIEEDVREARATFHVDCSEELLQTIREGALASAFTPRGIKAYVRDHI